MLADTNQILAPGHPFTKSFLNMLNVWKARGNRQDYLDLCKVEIAIYYPRQAFWIAFISAQSLDGNAERPSHFPGKLLTNNSVDCLDFDQRQHIEATYAYSRWEVDLGSGVGAILAPSWLHKATHTRLPCPRYGVIWHARSVIPRMPPSFEEGRRVRRITPRMSFLGSWTCR